MQYSAQYSEVQCHQPLRLYTCTLRALPPALTRPLGLIVVPVPALLPFCSPLLQVLVAWDEHTLRAGRYTHSSDVYQVGVMMKAWSDAAHIQLSVDAQDCLRKLLSHDHTATAIVQMSPWLAQARSLFQGEVEGEEGEREECLTRVERHKSLCKTHFGGVRSQRCIPYSKQPFGHQACGACIFASRCQEPESPGMVTPHPALWDHRQLARCLSLEHP